MYNLLMQEKAIIFDLDGTLWDATKTIAEAWQIVGRKELDPSFTVTQEKAKGFMGWSIYEISDLLAAKGRSVEEMRTFSQRCADFELELLEKEPGILYEGEEEVLSLLAKEYSLYVVSNCQNGYIETYLHSLSHPEVFKGHLCHGDTGQRKGITIQTLMKKHGICEAIYVGDTKKDEIETHFAGLPFVFASYGFGEAISPEGKISSLKELPKVAAALFEQMD